MGSFLISLCQGRQNLRIKLNKDTNRGKDIRLLSCDDYNGSVNFELAQISFGPKPAAIFQFYTSMARTSSTESHQAHMQQAFSLTNAHESQKGYSTP